MKRKKYQVNKFYEMAEQIKNSMTDEEDIKKRDLTHIFLKEIEYMVTNDEIVKISINAKMRLGKSTVGFTIGNYIMELLKKTGRKPKNYKFGISNIARDQTEYSRMMKDHTRYQDVIVVDESSESEDTGENSTTMQAVSRDQSNIQAARYIHDIKISPKDLNDRNSDLILDVVSLDKDAMTNFCYLSYRYQQSLQEHTIILGHVNLYVGSIIKNWISKGQSLHRKKLDKNISKQEEQELKILASNDWYVDYMMRKHFKMDLMNVHGITRSRTLEYAGIYLKIIEELEPLTNMTGLITERLVRSYIKSAFREAKIDLSIIGEINSVKDVLSILDLYIAKKKIGKDIAKIYGKVSKDQLDDQVAGGKIAEYTEVQMTLDKAILVRLKELRELNALNKEFNELVVKKQ